MTFVLIETLKFTSPSSSNKDFNFVSYQRQRRQTLNPVSVCVWTEVHACSCSPVMTSQRRQYFTAGEHTKQEERPSLSYTVSLSITAQYEVFCLAWLGFNKTWQGFITCSWLYMLPVCQMEVVAVAWAEQRGGGALACSSHIRLILMWACLEEQGDEIGWWNGCIKEQDGFLSIKRFSSSKRPHWLRPTQGSGLSLPLIMNHIKSLLKQ